MDNCWDRHRVHLIFDYIEDFTLERLRLQVRACTRDGVGMAGPLHRPIHPSPPKKLTQPGVQLHQTRRSIDLASEKGQRPCPSYLILGACAFQSASHSNCLLSCTLQDGLCTVGSIDVTKPNPNPPSRDTLNHKLTTTTNMNECE